MFPSRTDPDPGNHGRRKVLVATDEIAKRVSHPENLGRSLNTMKQVFRIGKDSKYNNVGGCGEKAERPNTRESWATYIQFYPPARR